MRITRPQESDIEDQRPLDLRYGRHLSPYGYHTDEHPSLHAYPTAEQGWHCFSCGRGGSVYDLAAELFGIQPRGVEFLKLRALLEQRLLTPSAGSA